MSVHNFKNTQVIIGGVIATGFFDGSAISAERNEDSWSQHIGAAGEVTWNELNNETGTFTFSFKPESSTVPFLRALHKSKESFDVMVNDSSLNHRITGTDCRVQKIPPFARAEEVEAVEVVILTANFKED